MVKCVRKVDWKNGEHWNGVAMVGDRVNNTAPGIRATAGYTLRSGGFASWDGVHIGELLPSLEDGLTAGQRSRKGGRDLKPILRALITITETSASKLPKAVCKGRPLFCRQRSHAVQKRKIPGREIPMRSSALSPETEYAKGCHRLQQGFKIRVRPAAYPGRP